MGRHFSLELKSKNCLGKINIHEGNEGVIIEGGLGNIQSICLLENSLLEFQGSMGVLRLEVTRKELNNVLHEGLAESSVMEVQEKKRNEK